MLLKSDLKKDQKDKLFDDLGKWSNAKSPKSESMGERKLSYPIRSEKKGEYVVINLETDRIEEDFAKRLLIRDEVLRYLLVRTK